MTVVTKRPPEVADRLAQLGWTRSELLQVVDAMVAAKNTYTINDPASARGYMPWRAGTRRLREIGLPKGLLRDDAENVPSVCDPKRRIKISVMNTEDGTGTDHGIPQNRRKKGAATVRAVGANQGSFMDDLIPPSEPIPFSRIRPQPGIFVHWYLCVYCEGDDVRAELACPKSADEGFLTEFHERIILFDGSEEWDTGDRADQPDEPASEYDIPVSRKK